MMTLQPKLYQYKRYLYGMLCTNKQSDMLCYVVLAHKKHTSSFVKNAQQICI